VGSLCVIEVKPLLIGKIFGVEPISHIWVASFLDVLTGGLFMLCSVMLFQVFLGEDLSSHFTWEDESNE
jgi:hypothetical protein